MQVIKNVRSAGVAGPHRWAFHLAAKAATALAVCGALLWSAGRLAAQTNGVWNVTTSGSAAGTNLWSTATNWQGGVIADGMDSTADFSQLTLSRNETVHFNSSRTVGNLLFGDLGNTYNWTLDNNGQAANTLTLATSYYESTISVNSGVAKIGAAVAGQGFTLNPNGGSGTLVLSGVNTYAGGTSINGGTLQAGATNSIPSASDFSVASGATMMLSGFSQRIRRSTERESSRTTELRRDADGRQRQQQRRIRRRHFRHANRGNGKTVADGGRLGRRDAHWRQHLHWRHHPQRWNAEPRVHQSRGADEHRQPCLDARAGGRHVVDY